MNTFVGDILIRPEFGSHEIVRLLEMDDAESINELYDYALKVKDKYVGKKVYFRALIEFSNICTKNCYYCQLRIGNKHLHRFELSEKNILDSAIHAYDSCFGSVILQSGERDDEQFVNFVLRVIEKIKDATDGKLSITLSCGEQSYKTFKRFYNAGVDKYLLRIETSNAALYKKLHPENDKHSFENRIECIQMLKDIGFQVGSGVMVGLPFQTIEDMAEDILFFKEKDVDNISISPYMENCETPLYEHRNILLPQEKRFELTLKMIAILRILMKDINLASTANLQLLDPKGKEKGLKCGANVILPNISPVVYNEALIDESSELCVTNNGSACLSTLDYKLHIADADFAMSERGDSKHFIKRTRTVKDK